MDNVKRHVIPEAEKQALSKLIFAIGYQLVALRDIGKNVLPAEAEFSPNTMGLCIESIANRAGRLVDSALLILGDGGIGAFEEGTDY